MWIAALVLLGNVVARGNLRRFRGGRRPEVETQANWR